MTKILNESDFNLFEKRYRANFFNSIVGCRSLNLIGTKNKEGNSNLAIFSSVFHIGSNPPYIGVIFRPSDGNERHTLGNILETGFFTMNHISESIYKKAHQTSAKYHQNQSEFEECQLSEDYLDDFFPPFVSDSPIKFGLEFVELIDLTFNKTQLLVGKIVKAIVPEQYIMEDGFINLVQTGTMVGVGIDGYGVVENFKRLSYAKPSIDTPEVIFSYPSTNKAN